MSDLSSSQGRYYLLDNGPVVSPGSCAICGFSGRERRYLDPRLDFEFYGSVIFCELCVGAMVTLFGYLTHEQAVGLEKRVEDAERELIKLRAVTSAMEDFNVAVRAASGATFSGDRNNIPGGDSGEYVAAPGESDAVDAAIEGRGDSTFDVSDLSEGPDDVSDAPIRSNAGNLSL